jgi:peptidoglycan/xylan/chitin deacetylase (PgdA/CDA1 family)
MMIFKKIFKKSKQSIYSIRYINNLIFHDAIILMYHRVADVKSDPWSLAVKPQHFEEQMEVLCKYSNLVSLQQLRKNLQSNKPFIRSVVVTFDDGYVDNLINAKPILEKFNIPATVFITTGYVDHNHEFWWDELDRLLMQTERLPGFLELTIRGKTYKWKTEDPMNSNNSDSGSGSFWRKRSELQKDSNWRNNLYNKVYNKLRFLDAHERDQVLKELRIWANAESSSQDNKFSLSSTDLIDLEEGGLIEIGAHTVSHPHLPEIPLNMQRDEINNSKGYLENIVGHKVNSFAYPFGSYTKDTIMLVKEAGFNCACSCISAKVRRHSNLNLLPRVAVEDYDGETFARWMSRIAW